MVRRRVSKDIFFFFVFIYHNRIKRTRINVLSTSQTARDIQKWEYVPLGPFCSKNVGTSISPWIVTMEALEPFRIPNNQQDPIPFPYLRHKDACNFDIKLEVDIKCKGDQLSFLFFLFLSICFK